jgi:hypothetical protein
MSFFAADTRFHSWMHIIFTLTPIFKTIRPITFVPGLYTIFDEIMVNAADNKQRDSSMDTIKVEVYA